MFLFYQFATGFYANTKVYYIKYLANQYKSYALFNAIAGVAEASAFPLNYALTMKFGKKHCGSIVTPFMVAGLAIGLFMMPSSGGASSVFWALLMLLSMILYPFGMSGLGFVSTNVFPDLTDVDELITGRRREGVISTFNTLIKKSVAGVMAAFVGFILQGCGLVTGDVVKEYEAVHNTVYPQTSGAVFGVRLCVAIIPIIAAIISWALLHKFQMTKEDHKMICAAVATKHKYGAVILTEEEKERIELVSGQKLENTWLGKNNGTQLGHTLEKDGDGNYIILIEKEQLKNEETKKEKTEEKSVLNKD